MATEWINLLKSAYKTCLNQDGRCKVHYTFPNKDEMAEEYSLGNYQLMVRKWRRKTTGLTGVESWKYEVGEPLNPAMVLQAETLRENINNPIFMRLDKKEHFQWRIRNLPYPLNTYNITVDDKNQIIVRTTNKKYYKKFPIPDMERLGLSLDGSSLAFNHANDTLIISYKKPEEVLDLEKMVRAELKKVKDDGDICEIPGQVCCVT